MLFEQSTSAKIDGTSLTGASDETTGATVGYVDAKITAATPTPTMFTSDNNSVVIQDSLISPGKVDLEVTLPVNEVNNVPASGTGVNDVKLDIDFTDPTKNIFSATLDPVYKGGIKTRLDTLDTEQTAQDTKITKLEKDSKEQFFTKYPTFALMDAADKTVLVGGETAFDEEKAE